MAFDFGKGLTGTLSGAYAGSAFGPLGTSVGAGIGGIAGLFGGGNRQNKRSTFDPQQQELYNQQMQGLQGQGPLADLYNYDPQRSQGQFDQNVAQPAYQQFQENTIPSITGQFRGNNLGESSYAGESLSRAGRDVQRNLDTQRSNFMFNQENSARQSRQSGIKDALNQSTFAYTKEDPSSLDQIFASLGPQAGEWLAEFLQKRKSGASSSTPLPTLKK